MGEEKLTGLVIIEWDHEHADIPPLRTWQAPPPSPVPSIRVSMEGPLLTALVTTWSDGCGKRVPKPVFSGPGEVWLSEYELALGDRLAGDLTVSVFPSFQQAAHPVTHRCPPDGEPLMPCCGRTPYDVPRTDKLAMDEALVTCKGPDHD